MGHPQSTIHTATLPSSRPGAAPDPPEPPPTPSCPVPRGTSPSQTSFTRFKSFVSVFGTCSFSCGDYTRQERLSSFSSMLYAASSQPLEATLVLAYWTRCVLYPPTPPTKLYSPQCLTPYLTTGGASGPAFICNRKLSLWSFGETAPYGRYPNVCREARPRFFVSIYLSFPILPFSLSKSRRPRKQQHAQRRHCTTNHPISCRIFTDAGPPAARYASAL